MYHSRRMKMKSTTLRIVLMTLVVLSSGLIVGAVIGSASAFFYPVFVMPLLGAFVVGLGMGQSIHWLRIAGVRMATILGSVSIVLLMGTALTMAYGIQRAAIVQELESSHGLTQETAQRYVDEALNERTGGKTGVLAPLWFRMYDGVRVTPSFQLDATPIGNAIVLFTEWGLALFLGVRMIRKRARQPYCHACDDWYTRRIVGTAPLGSLSTVQATLAERQFHRLGRRLDPPTTPQSVVVHCSFCLHCETGEVILELEVLDERNRRRIVRTVSAPHVALDDILASQALSSTKMGAAL